MGKLQKVLVKDNLMDVFLDYELSKVSEKELLNEITNLIEYIQKQEKEIDNI